ncbi:hypothetical protein M3Y97_00828800 [Aphelenchoides bicaudatus]|nr:hypothetical protein M3Y97_00828800 [Aphelenchoides bicaudatus]
MHMFGGRCVKLKSWERTLGGTTVGYPAHIFVRDCSTCTRIGTMAGEEVEKQSFNVSSAHPGKVVENGVDLLQRYIDNHSHLLGFHDRPADDKSSGFGPDGGYYGGKYDAALNRSNANNYDSDRRNTNNDSLNRIGSPYSDYGTKGSRKGVSFADDGTGRARSHSPSHGRSSGYGSNYDPYGSGAGLNSRDGTYDSRRNAGNYGQSPASTYDRNAGADRRPASARGNGAGNRRQQDLRSRTESPYTPFKWKKYQSYEPDDERRTIAPPYPTWLKDRGMTASYSALSKHKDDYNRYRDTFDKYVVSRLNRSSHEKDEEIKFSSYGDRLGSGIEMSRKRWTGGEIITDPTYLTKSLKPRTMFYSPIGDGVVAADGIELKRGPPDLNPRVHVTHERIVEYGKGKPGRREVVAIMMTMEIKGAGWPDDGLGAGWPDDGRGPKDDGRRKRDDGGPKYPADDGDGWPRNLGDGDPYGTLGSGDGYPRATPLSFNGGTPREGWTKTFIVNPRELINQYGTETLTTIFGESL